MSLHFLLAHPSVAVLCLWHIFHDQHAPVYIRHTHKHTLTLCLSLELYLSLVQTHMALVRPAPHRARTYIYPTLLLRVTNMGTDRRRGWGSPSYLPTMWSGPYIVMIVSVAVALTSTYCFTSVQSLGWLNAKRWPAPLCYSLWPRPLSLSPILHSHSLVQKWNSSVFIVPLPLN